VLLERLALQRKQNALEHPSAFLEKRLFIFIRPIDWNISHHQQLAADFFVPGPNHLDVLLAT